MAEELLLLSPAHIEAAANLGRLGRLTERLVEERSWSTVEMLLSHAALDVVPVEELVAAARAVDRTLARMPEARSRRQTIMREVAALRALAGRCLAKRFSHNPLTHQERGSVALAAELLMAAGEVKDAAVLFERAGADNRAADAHGAYGDLEKMEACHDRIERRRGAKRAAIHLTRKVESLVESGERVAALMLLDGAPPAQLVQATDLRQLREHLQRNICRGRALTLQLRGSHKGVFRFSGVPAVLGREPGVEIPLRDPGVSRRHAVIVSDGGQFVIEDATSRAGTTVAQARLVGRVAVPAQLEVGLGQSCRLGLATVQKASGETVVRVHGLTGLDRAFVAFVGDSPLALSHALDGLMGLSLHLEGGVARLERLASQPVKVAGQYIGLTCDLMIGDVVEVLFEGGNGGSDSLMFEVIG